MGAWNIFLTFLFISPHKLETYHSPVPSSPSASLSKPLLNKTPLLSHIYPFLLLSNVPSSSSIKFALSKTLFKDIPLLPTHISVPFLYLANSTPFHQPTHPLFTSILFSLPLLLFPSLPTLPIFTTPSLIIPLPYQFLSSFSNPSSIYRFYNYLTLYFFVVVVFLNSSGEYILLSIIYLSVL